MATEKKIERELAVFLSDEQRREAGRACAQKELDLREHEQDTAARAKADAKKKKDLRKEIKELAQQATSGTRTQMVQCLEITNWPSGVQVVRLDRKPGDADYVIEERPCDVNEAEKDVETPKPEKKGKGSAASRTQPLPGIEGAKPADDAAKPAEGTPEGEAPSEAPKAEGAPAQTPSDEAKPAEEVDPSDKPAEANAAPAEAPPADGSAPKAEGEVAPKARRRHLAAVPS